MKKSLFLSLLCFFLLFSIILCAIEGTAIEAASADATPALDEPSTQTTSSPKPVTVTAATASPSYTIEAMDDVSLVQGTAQVLNLTDDETDKLISFESSDNSIVTVDDGGRIDALKKGTATVTATFSNNKKYEYKITVVDEEVSEYDGFSTCITANTETLNKNKKTNSSKNLYAIKVNRKMNCVTVYTYDSDGSYTVPVRAMVCSCGENYGTITGSFGIYFKNEWHALYQNVYGHYVSGISGDYLFHSVPYYTPNSDDLEIEEFNKLGTSASLGCVRMSIADTKWIYDNCSLDTSVVIYDDDNAGPLGKPDTIKITDTRCGWDPTDDNKNNPYYNKTPQITGVSDCTITKGGSFYPLGSAKAVDTCSNDITDRITVIGNVITSKAGTYKVTYSVTDAMHRSTSVDITVTVK